MEFHRRLDEELYALRDRVLLMGGETALQRAMYALDAFTHGDAARARALINRDDEIDELYDRVFRDLIQLMASDPSTTSRAARLLFVAKHLERVGNYVTDICEMTVYMTEAEFIRHSN